MSFTQRCEENTDAKVQENPSLNTLLLTQAEATKLLSSFKKKLNLCCYFSSPADFLCMLRTEPNHFHSAFQTATRRRTKWCSNQEIEI